VRVVDEADPVGKLLDQGAGETDGIAMRFPADQVDQNIGYLAVLLLDFHSGQLVGKVLAVGQRLRLGVGGLVGDRIDRGAADALQVYRVGMDRNEQVGAVLPGNSHTFVEAQELVGFACHEDLVAAAGAKPVTQFGRKRQGDVLLDRSVPPLGAAIDAAMSGIDDDCEAAVGLPGRLSHMVAPGGRRRRAGGLGLQRECRFEVAFGTGRKIDGQPVSRRRLVFDHLEVVDPEWTPAGQDQPRIVGLELTVADALDQPACFQVPGLDDQPGLREIDDQAMRAAQQEKFGIGFAVEGYDDANMGAVAGHLEVAPLERRGEGARQHAEQQRQDQGCQPHSAADLKWACRPTHLAFCLPADHPCRAPRYNGLDQLATY
jgi:hypothetical protein